MKPGQVDCFLVVVEPTAKALEVGRRATQMIRERGLGHARVIANRTSGDPDAQAARVALGTFELTIVPEDAELRLADVQGRAPFDACPDSPAVRTLSAMSASLLV